VRRGKRSDPSSAGPFEFTFDRHFDRGGLAKRQPMHMPVSLHTGSRTGSGGLGGDVGADAAVGGDVAGGLVGALDAPVVVGDRSAACVGGGAEDVGP
jgi:hypothetical protein